MKSCSLFLLLVFLYSGEKSNLQFKSREDLVKNFTNNSLIPVENLSLNSQLNSNLKVQLWATSPQVFSPISMDIDSKGRVWVVEGVNYRAKNVSAGVSIVILEDTNNDGGKPILQLNLLLTRNYVKHLLV